MKILSKEQIESMTSFINNHIHGTGHPEGICYTCVVHEDLDDVVLFRLYCRYSKDELVVFDETSDLPQDAEIEYFSVGADAAQNEDLLDFLARNASPSEGNIKIFVRPCGFDTFFAVNVMSMTSKEFHCIAIDEHE